ncbi:MAG: PKD domain-containing protein [Candidatus Cloacimonetes bacterium]|nr:PKD domain-containing protein [Candidatus Cloacimonadota bacterium]
MKKIIILTILLFCFFIAKSVFAVNVDGYCYLDGETNHSGTKVLFTEVSPSAETDSTFTYSNGTFSIELSVGVYTVHYSHEGWFPYTIPGDVLFSEDTTLDDVTLSPGLLQEVSGPQVGIWTSGNLYQVIGDISINNGDTLIIEPGVIVKFMDYYSFTIYGTLLAQGTETDSILFTSGQTTANPGDWNQIKFENLSDSNSVISVISYSKIEYANYYGIYCYSSSPTIRNNMICNNGYGIACSNSSPTIINNTISNNTYGIVCDSSPTIINNTISNNDYGIRCSNSSPTISNNTICNNYWLGISCADSSSATINNNTICNSYDAGILCSSSSPTISNNTISNNNDDGIFCSSSSPTILNNILYDNYRGIYADLSPSSLEYNLFWINNNAGSGGGIPSAFGETVIVNGNGDPCDTYFNLFMDPLFVDPSNLDFHLTEDSPCKDAGNPESPSDPDGTIADIGAFYFHQSGIITPPNANFSAYPTSGNAPLIVAFTDESIPGTYSITSWFWDFGDGNTSIQQNPMHTYSNPGFYTASLTVTDEYDSTDTETKIDYITVGSMTNPTAYFTADIKNGYAPLTVNFTDKSIQGPGVIVEWYWIFGDGYNSYEQDPTHIYQDPGTYTVTLTVTDENDSTDIETKEDFITVVSPNTDFSADITSGIVPLTVQFTDQSSGNIISWKWDFDNDSNIDSYNQNPIYTYTEIGIYTVSLIVSYGTYEDTETKENYITVQSPIPNAFTPNGDGLNDEFVIYLFDDTNAETSTLTIYNSQGSKLIDIPGTSGLPLKWDGKDKKGADCKMNAYLYVLRINGTVSKRGIINLIR